MSQIQLTEEEVLERDEIFFNILEQFIDDTYDVSDDYMMDDDNEAMVEAVKEYFDSTFRFPTLRESALESYAGYDINNDLYEELSELMLDESIGGVIAGARFGVKQALAGYRKNRASSQWNAAKQKHDKLEMKSKSNMNQNNQSSFQRAKAARIQSRVNSAKTSRDAALTKKKSTAAAQQNTMGRRNSMANKIDTGIQSGIQKVKDTGTAIKNRAVELKNKAIEKKNKAKEKIGGFFGDIAGRFA